MFITDNKNPSSALIKAVHQFYPVGFNMPNIQYEGFSQLQEILTIKNNNVSQNTIPENLKKLEERLRSHFGLLPIYIEYYKQFPSYSIVIELFNRQHEGVQHIQRLAIKVSLLINYYTIYYEDYIKYNGLMYELGPVNTTVASFQLQNEKTELKNINAVEHYLQECFPEYFYVKHDLLFNLKIHHGTLIDEELELASEIKTVFSFLFDNQFYASLLVVE